MRTVLRRFQLLTVKTAGALRRVGSNCGRRPAGPTVNEGQIVHSWVVEAAGVGTPGVRPGESFVLTLNR
ncbi:MAG: hypothetical protein ACRD12_04355, partial [Acidimicrobiales bacterium]